MLGFVEKQNGSYFLSTFENRQRALSFNEGTELRADDPYVAGLIGRIEKIYLAVSPKDIHFRVLKLPFAEREKIADIIPFQLEGMTIESMENIVFDFAVIDRAGDEYRVVVAFMYKQVLRRILDELAGFNIRPEVITSLEAFPALSRKSIQELAGAGPLSLPEPDRIDIMREILRSDTINLARGEFTYEREREQAGRYARVAVSLVLIIALLLAAHFILDIRNVRTEERKIRQDMVTLYSQVVPGDKKIVDPLYQLKAQLKQISGKYEEMNDANPLPVLESIARTWKSGRSLESIRITSDSMTLTGEAENAGEVEALADSLLPKDGPKPVIETRQASGGKTGYTLQIKGRTGR